jgi:hypothetical protein
VLTPVLHVKKKIAFRLNTDTAYEILMNSTFKYDVEEKIFVITVTKPLELTPYQDKILLNEIRAVYGEQEIEGIEYIVTNPSTSEKKEKKLILNLGKEGSIWHKISSKLLEHYGEGLHKSWFSKLEVQEEDKTNKKIILKAPTNFISDWIKSNYSTSILNYFKLIDPEFKSIEIVT